MYTHSDYWGSIKSNSHYAGVGYVVQLGQSATFYGWVRDVSGLWLDYSTLNYTVLPNSQILRNKNNIVFICHLNCTFDWIFKYKFLVWCINYTEPHVPYQNLCNIFHVF